MCDIPPEIKRILQRGIVFLLCASFLIIPARSSYSFRDSSYVSRQRHLNGLLLRAEALYEREMYDSCLEVLNGIFIHEPYHMGAQELKQKVKERMLERRGLKKKETFFQKLFKKRKRKAKREEEAEKLFRTAPEEESLQKPKEKVRRELPIEKPKKAKKRKRRKIKKARRRRPPRRRARSRPTIGITIGIGGGFGRRPRHRHRHND